jgi:hypothetical protein
MRNRLDFSLDHEKKDETEDRVFERFFLPIVKYSV